MLKGFLLAVAAGIVAGTAFPVVILAIAILGSSGASADIRTMLGIVAAAVLMPLILVTGSALLLGLPATFTLKALRSESGSAYTTVGAILGFLVPGAILAIAQQDAGVFFNALPGNLLGAFSGGVTGGAWGRYYREAAGESVG